ARGERMRQRESGRDRQRRPAARVQPQAAVGAVALPPPRAAVSGVERREFRPAPLADVRHTDELPEAERPAPRIPAVAGHTPAAPPRLVPPHVLSPPRVLLPPRIVLPPRVRPAQPPRCRRRCG